MFYLRLVLLARQLVRGGFSGRWWAEHNEANRSGWDSRDAPALFCFCFSHIVWSIILLIVCATRFIC